MRILLVAEEAAGVRMLRALAGSDDDLVAVMARADRDDTGGASVWTVARHLGYETWPAEGVRDVRLADRIDKMGVDLVLNVHSLFVVHPTALATPRLGWFNLHPGLLPRYAGLNTVSWAIYEGATRQGVTVHRMVEAVDAGPIAYEESFPIQETDTGLSLSSRCVDIGVRLMSRLVETFRRDPEAVPAIERRDGPLHYYRRDDIPEGGRFGWDQPARRIVEIVRAFDYHPLASPWGHPRMELGGREVGVGGARRTGLRADGVAGSVQPDDGRGILVACQDEWVGIRRIYDDGGMLDAAAIMRPTAGTTSGSR